MKAVLLLLSILLTSHAYARDFDSMSLKMGAGFTHNTKSALFGFDWQRTTENHFAYKFDFGFWSDNEDGQSGSFYGAVLIGPQFGSYDSWNGSLMGGVLFHTTTDRLLGTPYQFTEEISVGYKEYSVGFKHISNAGIEDPNIGRDYLFFKYTLPLTY